MQSTFLGVKCNKQVPGIAFRGETKLSLTDVFSACKSTETVKTTFSKETLKVERYHSCL